MHIDDIDGYDALYLPYPSCCAPRTREGSEAGWRRAARLVSEGCPGYFGDGGAAGDVQPNLGLDELFGVREAAVEFTPDLLDGTTFRLDGKQDVGCAEYLQTYETGSARPCGFLADGGVVAAENGFGKGRTLLMGTCPSLAYMRHPGPAGSAFFADLLRWLGVEQAVSVDNGDVKARLHASAEGLFLWALNMSRQPQQVDIGLAARFAAAGLASTRWGDQHAAQWQGGRIRATIPGRDALVLQIATTHAHKAPEASR